MAVMLSLMKPPLVIDVASTTCIACNVVADDARRSSAHVAVGVPRTHVYAIAYTLLPNDRPLIALAPLA